MEQITISKIYFNPTNKEGQPYLDRNQRPFQMVKLVTSDSRTLWGKAYQGSPILNWKAGESYEVEIESRGGYANFRLPRANSTSPDLTPRVERLEEAVRLLQEEFEALRSPQADDEIPDDLPF